MKQPYQAPRTEQIQISAEYSMLAPSSVGMGSGIIYNPGDVL